MKTFRKALICIMSILVFVLCACQTDLPLNTSDTVSTSPVVDASQTVKPRPAPTATPEPTPEPSPVFAREHDTSDNYGMNAETLASLHEALDSTKIYTSVVIKDGVIVDEYYEQNKDARPKLSTQIDNLDNYDVIFLGYPNWWADLPQPLYTFLEEYDLSGKTIIPFCPHDGSGFSKTIDTIAKLQPDATVDKDGYLMSRNNVANAESDVIEWLAGLNY